MSEPGAADTVRIGASWEPGESRFTLFSRFADAVELCLFDADGSETARRELQRRDDGLWTAEVEHLVPGQRYAYRVRGPYAPGAGHRFNPAKLLTDPGALALTGEPVSDEALVGGAPGDAGAPDRRDSAPFMPRSILVDPGFDWCDDRPPATPWSDTVIYECHVRGLTMRHPEIAPARRGTYLGLASEPVIDHLTRLGVTAVELLPVHQIASEPHLSRRGLSNYFGYSPLGFFAPHAGYASTSGGGQVAEFKEMVRRLHAVGIEVLLDVVFNHTAEGDHRGPTLSLRGIDNRSYYRLDPADRSRYEDLTGTGNTLDVRSPATLALIVSCLTYWVEEMHVDGFRFDLAPVLGRARGRDGAFDPRGPFFEQLAEVPALSRVKLIAEPWDLGPDGYQLGRFPNGWREWNDRFRDATRSFWRADRSSAEALRLALTGSPDVFDGERRSPPQSIDFATCHDGFTLADLVSFESKHNQANGESNRDGADHNLSRNWGTEGPTDDASILELRCRAARNILMTLALAPGVPMLAHGDELGRSQAGNNNAYCQDNESTWVDWRSDGESRRLLDFTRRAFGVRRDLGIIREVELLSPDARSLDNLARRRLPILVLRLIGSRAEILMLANGSDRARLFKLPGVGKGRYWLVRLTSFAVGSARLETATVRLPAHTSMVLQLSADRALADGAPADGALADR